MSDRVDLHEHVPEGDLALYVMGALESDRNDAIEAHVMGCGACAEGLAREARLEAAFDEMARRSASHADVRPFRPLLSASRTSRRGGRFMGGVAGALAAAAAIVLMFAQNSLADQGPSASQAHAGACDGAVGDMSGALVGDVRTEKLDGG